MWIFAETCVIMWSVKKYRGIVPKWTRPFGGKSMNYDKQRAGMLKRIPAWMLDMILLITLVTGLLALFAQVFDFNAYYEKYDSICQKYEQQYDISFGISAEEYNKLTPEKKEAFDAATEALDQDEEVPGVFMAFMNAGLTSLSLSIFGAYFILEFLIPLWLKNGQTIGKKVFGVALMRKDGVKVTPLMMFVRTVLGKYTVETMIPIYLLIATFCGFMGLEMTILALALVLAQVVVMLVTRDKTGLHDLMACTVAVDLGSQMIFDTPEAQLEYHKRIHEEIAAKADY